MSEQDFRCVLDELLSFSYTYFTRHFNVFNFVTLNCCIYHSVFTSKMPDWCIFAIIIYTKAIKTEKKTSY